MSAHHSYHFWLWLGVTAWWKTAVSRAHTFCTLSATWFETCPLSLLSFCSFNYRSHGLRGVISQFTLLHLYGTKKVQLSPASWSFSAAPLVAVLRKLALLAASVFPLMANLVSVGLFSFVYKADWKPQLKLVVNRGQLFHSSQVRGVSREPDYVKPQCGNCHFGFISVPRVCA